MRHINKFRTSGIPGLPCPCCPPRIGLPEAIFSTTTPTTPISSILTTSTPSLTPSLTDSEKPSGSKDILFTASVAELRRKAQEHSAALWQSLQQIHNVSNEKPELPEVPKEIEKVSVKEDISQ